jgi:hypothetical protein
MLPEHIVCNTHTACLPSVAAEGETGVQIPQTIQVALIYCKLFRLVHTGTVQSCLPRTDNQPGSS